MIVALTGFIIGQLGFDAAISLYYQRNIMKKEDVVRYQLPEYTYLSNYVKKKEQGTFYRIERDYVGIDGSSDYNYGMMTEDRTLSNYNSTLSRYLGRFCKMVLGNEIISSNSYAIGSYGDCYNVDVANMLGLKYIISMNDHYHSGWKVIKSYNGYYLYENLAFSDASRLYSDIISEQKYEKLNNLDKKILYVLNLF